MYLTTNYVCFVPAIGTSKAMISFEKIKEISKRRTARMNMNNAVEIITNDGQRYFFSAFFSRDKCYDGLISLWQKEGAHSGRQIESASNTNHDDSSNNNNSNKNNAPKISSGILSSLSHIVSSNSSSGSSLSNITIDDTKRVVVDPAIRYAKENKHLHDTWPVVADNEIVIDCHNCALDSATKQGRLYITNYYNMFFHSKIPFSEEIKEQIPFSAIETLGNNAGGMFNNTLEIITTQKKYILRNFMTAAARDQCYTSLSELLNKYMNRPRVFGIPLHEIVQRERQQQQQQQQEQSDFVADVPLIVQKLVKSILEKGIHLDGVFRISASKKEMDRVQILLDEGEVDVDIDTVSTDPYLPSGLLKKFFRDLPDPLFTGEFYSCFLIVYETKAVMTEEEEDRKLHDLMLLLPKENIQIAKYLIDFLVKVSENSAKNQMHLKNLAIVWAPLLFKSSNEGGYEQNSFKEAGLVVDLLLTVIQKRAVIFA